MPLFLLIKLPHDCRSLTLLLSLDRSHRCLSFCQKIHYNVVLLQLFTKPRFYQWEICKFQVCLPTSAALNCKPERFYTSTPQKFIFSISEIRSYRTGFPIMFANQIIMIPLSKSYHEFSKNFSFHEEN